MKHALMMILAAIAMPADAGACYAVEAKRSSVVFQIIQDGSPFSGSFASFGGELCLADAETVERIDVWLEPASVDTGLPELDAALQESEFFDSAKHPRLNFRSESVVQEEGGRLARGVLEVKGKAEALEVPFTLERGNGSYGVSGTFVMDRLKFDIGTGEWADTRWLGREVTVTFEAALESTNGQELQD